METFNVFFEGKELDKVSKELKELLRGEDIDVQIKPEKIGFDGFSLEPASLIVSGASVLSALITALLAYLANRRAGNIIISGSTGRKIEIPKDASEEEIEYYVRLARELDIDKINVK
jgi:sugar phosphate isomerase/epimerase